MTAADATFHDVFAGGQGGHGFAGAPVHIGLVPVGQDRRSRTDSELRSRAVFEHAPFGQIYTSVDGVVESVNVWLAELLGHQPEEMIGRPAIDFIPEHDRTALRVVAHSLLLAGATPHSDIRRFTHRDGREIPVRVTSWVAPAEDACAAAFVSMVIDLTREEQVQADLADAHDLAMCSKRRVDTLNAITKAAADVETLAEYAARVLSTVCTHFGWPGGALVGWPGESPHTRDAPQVLCSAGRDAELVARRCVDLAPPQPGPDMLPPVTRTGLLTVPITGTDGPVHALVFLSGHDAISPDDQQILAVLANTSSRVGQREDANRQLVISEARFRAAFDSSPLPMGLTLGETGTYHRVNEALCALVGRTADELIGTSARSLVHPDDVALTDPAGAAALAAPDGRSAVEVRLMHSSGRTISVLVTLAWMDGPDGSSQLLAQMHDVTSSRQLEELRRRQVEEDSLTGLMSRAALRDALTARGQGAQGCTAYFVDLDNFKMINDTRGNDAGDEVLVAVADRLRAACVDTDVIARFGGDEFVVVMPGLASEADADEFAGQVLARLAEPIMTSVGMATVTACIGIARAVVDPDQPKAVIQRADAAMQRAKRLGKNRRVFYGEDLDTSTRARRRMETALQHALDDSRLTVHYQPIVDLHDFRIVAVEALVRLIDENGDMVAPGSFISVAEDSGWIVPIGDWVLRDACATVAQIGDCGFPIDVAVNISAQQATRSNFVDTVQGVLAQTGLPTHRLALELTESALLEADHDTLRQLTTLHESGISVGLDDFGTGYSSLAYLRSFPVSHLKIDKAFIDGVTHVRSDRAIVRAVTALAEDLDLQWVAEGIETVEQRDALRAMGRRGFGQGYLFGRPMTADALLSTLSTSQPVHDERRRAS